MIGKFDWLLQELAKLFRFSDDRARHLVKKAWFFFGFSSMEDGTLLNLFFPMFYFDPPENIKPKCVSWGKKC